MNLPRESGEVGFIVATSNALKAGRVGGDCANIPGAARARSVTAGLSVMIALLIVSTGQPQERL
jgi:hypothetical protein